MSHSVSNPGSVENKLVTNQIYISVAVVVENNCELENIYLTFDLL